VKTIRRPSGDQTGPTLDFGLAKALTDDPATSNAANSPTLSLAATRVGAILGTAMRSASRVKISGSTLRATPRFRRVSRAR